MRSALFVKALRFYLPPLFLALVLIVLCIRANAQAQSGDSLSWTVKKLSDGQEDADTPTIVADQAGGLHIFWPQGEESGGETLYYAYNDGTRWTINDVIVGDSIEVVAVAIDDDQDILHLMWTENNTNLRYSYALIPAAASARGWAKPTTIAEEPIFSLDLLFDPRGILHVAYASIAADTSAIYYMRSTNGGQHWSPPTIFRTPRSDAATNLPQMAMGEDGTLHMVWSLVPTTNFYGGLGVYYSRSTDAGQSWSEPVRLDLNEEAPDTLGEEAWLASIAVVGSTEVHMVWDSHTYAGNRRHQWSRDGGLTWSAPQPIWGSFISQTGANPMIVDSAGTLYLFGAGAFDWSQRQGVYFSRWTGSNWTYPESVDLSSDGPHYIQLAVTTGNTLHAVWQARGAEPRGIWHTSARTRAPYVSPQPYPWVEAEPTVLPATPTSTVTPTATSPAPPPAPTRNWSSNVEATSNPLYALMVGVLPVALLIGAVVFFQTVWLRRR